MPVVSTQTALKKAMYVSVFNIILNLILVVLKAVAGTLAGSDVLISDAVHSAADTLCTILVLSGIGLAVKRPGVFAEKMQAAVILLLSVAIGCTGVSMGFGAVQLLLGFSQSTPPTGVAVAVAVACTLIKAGMSLMTARIAKRLQNDTLLADAYHHRSDCLSSLLVLVSVASSYLHFPVLDIPARLILGCILLVSAFSLAKNAIRKLCS